MEIRKINQGDEYENKAGATVLHMGSRAIWGIFENNRMLAAYGTKTVAEYELNRSIEK